MQAQHGEGLPVIVIGAGLAGLAAAATAARAGAPVIVVEAHAPGGRARTDVRKGFSFNQGPHALYRGGSGRRVLTRLGIRTAGHSPPLLTSRALVAGRPQGWLSRRTLGPRSKAQVARAFASLARPDAGKPAGRSAQQWIDSLGLNPDAAMVIAAFVRVATYVADLDRLPAEVAIGQARTGLKGGVEYLDGGWEQLTSGLLRCATASGAQVRPHAPVHRISGRPGRWEVHTEAEVIRASAVVVAAGRPAATHRLLPVEPAWGDMGPAVTAACLDLGLRRTDSRFVLGVDEPLYLSPHSPPGDLAPPGCGLVQVMRYGATTPAEDRQQLWGMAAATGITEADVMVQRFLPSMVVVNCLPPPERGLAGRAPVAVPGAPGVYVAGDWVGPRGWLADASLASGEQAGRLAAGAALERSRIAAAV
jgi:glycine/D-amino acid oxidase-like deaminating enzyme